MAWVKIDDQFTEQHNVQEAGPLCMALHVAALCYSTRLTTKGFISFSAARRLIDFTGIRQDGVPVELQGVIHRLCVFGFWKPCEKGWQIALQDQGQEERNSAEYRNWRYRVLSRDNNTCQDCGYQDVGLHVHHIIPFAEYPEHRTDPNNGVTLCADCHGQRHGRRLS